MKEMRYRLDNDANQGILTKLQGFQIGQCPQLIRQVANQIVIYTSTPCSSSKAKAFASETTLAT